MNLSAFAHLNGQWVAKKNYMPICGIKPALKIKIYPDTLRLIDENGRHYMPPKQRSVKLQLLQQLETIDESKAKLLNSMYADSNEVCLSPLFEPTPTASHFRTDNGQPKRAFDVTNFHDALYALRLKFPNHRCFAYECVECKQIHIGKI